MAKRTIEQIQDDYYIKQTKRTTNISVHVPTGLYYVLSDVLDAEWTSLTARSGARRGRELYDNFMTEAITHEIQRRRREGVKIKECVTHYGYYQITAP